MKRGIIVLILFLFVLSACSEFSIINKDGSRDYGNKLLVKCVFENTPECLDTWDLDNNGIVNVLDYNNWISRHLDIPRDKAYPGSRGDNLMSIENIDIDAGTLDIVIDLNDGEPIYGFQFVLTGITVDGISGGVAADAGYGLYLDWGGFAGDNIIMGINLDGTPIDQSGVLVNIDFSDYGGEFICFDLGVDENNDGWEDYNLLSNFSGGPIPTTWGECYCPSGNNDECGVCNGDNTICLDCAGELNGDLVEDCAGLCGGYYESDNCLVCDGDTGNDCVQDCQPVWGGTYSEDYCGTCLALGTSDPAACVQDCQPAWGGTWSDDNCGTCLALGISDPAACVQDCNGFWGGDAVVDECGVCGGDSSSCADCAGVPNGDSVEDCAGICDGSTIPDCAGVCGGGREFDDCGTCDGNAIVPDELLITEPGGDGCWCITDVWNVDYKCRFVEPKGHDLGLPSNLFFSDAVQGARYTVKGYCESKMFYDKMISVEDWVCGSVQVEEGYGYFGEDSTGCPGCIQDANGYYWDEWDDFGGDCNPDGVIDGGIYIEEFTCEFRNCPEMADLNSDTLWNVQDIVILANCVLGSYCEDVSYGCAADLNVDGYYNVIDLVLISNCILDSNCADEF